MLGEEGGALIGVVACELGRNPDAGGLDDAACHALVVADRHGDGRGELAQRFTAMHGAAAIGEPEKAALRVGDLDRDAAPPRFVDDDLGIDVQAFVGGGSGEQRLVDGVTALDRENRNALKAELFVQRDGLLIIVHDRQVHEGRAARFEMIGQPAHQRLADAAVAGLRGYGQTPKRRPALWIAEGLGVIDAHGRAEDFAGFGVLGHDRDKGARIALRPEEIRRHLHHGPRRIDDVHGFRVFPRRQPADQKGRPPPVQRSIGSQVEPVGMRRIQEQLLRRGGKQHMRVADIEGDVAPVGAFGAQQLGEPLIGCEGLGEDQPAPAAIQGGLNLLGGIVRPGILISQGLKWLVHIGQR